MKNDYVLAFLITVLSVVAVVIFATVAIDPGKHESDPAVYERYVEDMRSVGRKPNGELLDAGELN